MIFDKLKKEFNGRKVAFSQNDARTTGHKKEKKERSVNLSLTLYASLSLDGSQTEVKMQHNNSFRKKNRRKSSGCRAKERVHRFDTKSKISERKFHQLDLIKIKIFCSVKHSLMKMKTQTIDWRKYLQTYLTKD